MCTNIRSSETKVHSIERYVAAHPEELDVLGSGIKKKLGLK